MVLSRIHVYFLLIVIKYGKYDEIVISPCRKEEFISDLKSINDRIVV